MSAVSGEQRERASSGREWRKKKNDENPWSLDLETESGETPENERTKETGLNREARLRKKKRKKRKERKKKLKAMGVGAVVGGLRKEKN
jgi:hypothetical protein